MCIYVWACIMHYAEHFLFSPNLLMPQLQRIVGTTGRPRTRNCLDGSTLWRVQMESVVTQHLWGHLFLSWSAGVWREEAPVLSL